MNYPYNQPGGYEEPLNRQVTGHLYYSLQFGPELVDELFTDVGLSFAEDAAVVAGQDDPLPYTPDNEIDREIDWVVRDRDSLVGFESKYGSSLKRSQLDDELTKLRANADGRTVRLVAITDHATEPGLFDAFEDEPVTWTSWTAIASRVSRIEAAELPPAQRVPLRMLQDLFEAENMEPFRGFDHHDKRQYRYFIRDLQPEVRKIELEHRGDLHTWTQNTSRPSSYARIVPKYVAIPFVHRDRPPHGDDGRPQSRRASVFVVIVDTETHRTYAGVVFGVRKVPAHREMLLEHGDRLAETYASAGFELWIAPHSVNHRGTPVEKTSDGETMKDWLSTAGKRVLEDPSIDNTYKKTWFVTECSGSEPAALFESVVDVLTAQRERFLDDDRYLETATLADPDTV